MRNVSGDKPLGKRASSKARIREVAERIGNSALSLVLVLSLMPAPSIAYALDEEDVPVVVSEEQESETTLSQGHADETAQEEESQAAEEGAPDVEQSSDEDERANVPANDGQQEEGEGIEQQDETEQSVEGVDDEQPAAVEQPVADANDQQVAADDSQPVEGNIASTDVKNEEVIVREVTETKTVRRDAKMASPAPVEGLIDIVEVVDTSGIKVVGGTGYTNSAYTYKVEVTLKGFKNVSDLKVDEFYGEDGGWNEVSPCTTATTSDSVITTFYYKSATKPVTEEPVESEYLLKSEYTVGYSYSYIEEDEHGNPETKFVTKKIKLQSRNSANLDMIVVDTTKPTITADIVKDADSLTSETLPIYADSDINYNYNLEDNNDKLFVRVVVEDDHPDRASEATNAAITWEYDDPASTGLLPDDQSFVFERYNSSNITLVSYLSFDAGSFVNDNNELLVGKIGTLKATDLAGNEAVYAGLPIKFTSETGLINKALEPAKIENLEVVPETAGVKAAARNAKTVYNGNVAVKLGDALAQAISDGLLVTATDTVNGSTTTPLTYDASNKGYLVSPASDSNDSHSVSLTFKSGKTSHGVESTKNVTITASPENGLAFETDTTAPSATVTLSNAADAVEVSTDVFSYRQEINPEVQVSIQHATTLASAPTVTLAEGKTVPADKISWKNSSDAAATFGTDATVTGTFTVDDDMATTLNLDEETTSYKPTVSFKNIFEVDGSATSDKSFILDHSGPEIVALFSGPGRVLELGKKIAAFFNHDGVADENRDSAYTGTSNIGSVTITVTDKTLDPTTLEVTAGSYEGSKDSRTTINSSDWTVDGDTYQISIPYAADDGFYLGQGNHKQFEVKASDTSGNTTIYQYSGKDAADGADGADDDSDFFVVDTESPVIEDLVLSASSPKTYQDNSGNTIAAYNVSSLTITAEVKDNNFDPDSSVVSVQKYVNGNKKGNAKEYTGSDWSSGKVDITLEDDGGADNTTYKIVVTANDKLLNATSKRDFGFFAVDDTEPVVTITPADSPTMGSDSIRYFKAESESFTITARDASFTANNAPTNTTVNYVDNNSPQTVTDGWQWNETGCCYEFKVGGNDLAFVQNEPNVTYTIDPVQVSDLFNKTGSASYLDFRVDNVAPVIQKVTFSQAPIGAAYGEDFYIGASDVKVIVTITVKDNNYDSNKEISKVVATNGTWDQTWVNDASDGSIWTTTVTYQATPANESADFTITATDFATNTATEKNAYKDWSATLGGDACETFVIDVDTPKVTVKFDEAPVGMTDSIDYYDADKVTATIMVEDDHFDPTVSAATDANKDAAATTYGDWTNTSGNIWERTVAYKQVDAHAVWSNLSVAFQDKAYTADGSISGHNGTWGYETGARDGQTTSGASKFILDNKPIELSVEMSEAVVQTVTVDGKKVDFYNRVNADKQLVATITVVDNNFDKGGDIKNLIKGVHVAKIDDDWTTTDGQTYVAHAYFTENTGVYDPSDLTIGVQDLVQKAADEHPGDGSMVNQHTATTDYCDSLVKDKAGTSTSSDGFIVDVTNPMIDVVVDQPMVGAFEGVDYYASKTGDTLRATVTVTDRNFDPNVTKSLMELPTEKVGSSKTTGAWSGNWMQDGTDKAKWTTSLTFKETEVDFEEFFKGLAFDYATNKTGYEYGQNVSTSAKKVTTSDADGAAVKSKTFVLDTVRPSVTVTFSEVPVGKVNNRDYYAKAPKATITVVDRNFQAAFKDSPILPSGGKITREWAKDGDTWTAEVEFGENRVGDYYEVETSKLDVRVEDKVYMAGKHEGHINRWKYETGKRGSTTASGAPVFVVDLTKPTIKVELDKPVKQTFNERDFYADDVTATITIVDNNFDITVGTGSAIVAKPEDATTVAGTWKTSDRRSYTRTIKFGENKGIGSPSDFSVNAFDFVFTASGKSKGQSDAHQTRYGYRRSNTTAITTVVGGNPAATAKYLVVDKTAPEMLSVNVNNPVVNTGATGTGSGVKGYNGASTTLTFNFKDACGLEFVEATDQDGQYVVGKGASSFNKGDTKNSGLPMTLSENGNHAKEDYDRKVKVTVTDIAGNYREWSISENGKVLASKQGNAGSANVPVEGAGHPDRMIQDTKSPVINFTSTPRAGSYNNTSQSATLTVGEFNFNELLRRFNPERGIIRVYRSATEGGERTLVREITAGDGGWSGSDQGSWVYTESASFVADGAHDGHYTLEAQFEDWHHNASNSVKVAEFTIDATKPVINSITFDDGDNFHAAHYYDASRTATITITEHNFDPGRTVVRVNGQQVGVSWSNNGDVHTATWVFDEGNDWSITVDCTDKAGNVATQLSSGPFSVDLHDPDLKFYLVPDDAPKENYDQESDDVPKAFNNESLVGIIEFSDNQTETGNLKGGVYEFVGAKTSLAEERTAEGLTAGEKEVANQGDNAAMVSIDFPDELVYDDIYTLTASVSDLAGRKVEKEFTFSVNRFGSNYEVIDAENYADESGIKYLNEAPEVQVREVNVSETAIDEEGKKLRSVAVNHGLDTNDLVEQQKREQDKEGFFVEEDHPTSQSGWAENDYYVWKPNFPMAEDGLYSVVVSSTDAVDNINQSNEYVDHDEDVEVSKDQMVAIADATVEFLLDRVAPAIDDVNFENATMYDHGKEGNENLTFNVTDNFELKSVTARVDDSVYVADLTGVDPVLTKDGSEVELDEATGTTIEAIDGGYAFSIPVEAKSWTKRAIVIDAKDKANNGWETEDGDDADAINRVERNDFKNTSDIFELHGPIFAALGAAVIGIVALVIAWRRRKEDEDDQLS